MALGAKYGVRIAAVNPNLFQDQIYKYGSLGKPDPEIRKAALQHILDCVGISKQTGSRQISLWFGDSFDCPGTANMRRRRKWFEE